MCNDVSDDFDPNLAQSMPKPEPKSGKTSGFPIVKFDNFGLSKTNCFAQGQHGPVKLATILYDQNQLKQIAII